MTFQAALGVLVLIGLGVVLLFLWRMVRSPLPLEMREELERKTDAKLNVLKEEWSSRLRDELSQVWSQMQAQVSTTEQSVSQKLQQANQTLAGVTQILGRLQESTRRVEEVGKDVTTLQDLLKAPKLRGGIGEFFLADLLAQIMPSEHFVLQYSFSDGQQVDAAIRLRDKVVPVDSKFPLEQFRKMGQAATDPERSACRREFVRDVKQHIDAIAEKYIRPEEGTFNFALMYIPAENVYYETIIKEDGVADDKGIFRHAVARRVIPVSPNSFYAYLQVILQGLRGFKIEQQAKEILASLMKLSKEMAALREDFSKAGKQMGFAKENFDKAERHLSRFEDRLAAIEALPETDRKKLETVEAVREKEEVETP